MIRSKPSSDQYRQNFEKIFGKGKPSGRCSRCGDDIYWNDEFSFSEKLGEKVVVCTYCQEKMKRGKE